MSTQLGKHKILYNGKIITVDKDFSIAQAVSIRDGKFLIIGSNEEVRASASPDTEMVDLKGKTVVPGFVDSHNHMLWTALEKPKVSVASARSIADLLAIIGDACKAAGPGEWIETSQVGFEPVQLKENRSPNRWELDTVSPNNPVIHEEHFHYSVVNSYALRLVDITRDTPEPVGGIIAKDTETGEPTGWLGDTALDLVKALVPHPTHEEKVKLLKSTMEDFNKLGITSVIDPWLRLEDLKVYQEVWASNQMTVRAKIMLAIPPLAGSLTPEQIRLGLTAISREAGLDDFGDDVLRIDGLKTVLDSGIQGTFFRNPYLIIPGEQENPNYRGITSMSEEAFKELCSVVAQSGWRLGVHCAGDAAIDLLLDIWGEINKETPIVDKHWVLIHGQFPRPEHFDRIKRLGLRVACQSAHTYTMGADMVKWWGLERACYSNPIRSYLRNGVRVGGGSDAFFCEWNPSALVWFDVTRQSKWAGVLGSDQAISREESLVYHTIDASLVSGDEDKQGSIEPGKLADLVVLSDNILTCPVERVKDIKALMTMVGGEVVYQRQPFD